MFTDRSNKQIFQLHLLKCEFSGYELLQDDKFWIC